MSEAESNGIDEVKARRFVAEIERCDDELLSLKMEYAAKAKGPKERKSDWMEQARDAGLPTAALKLELKRRALDRKQKALVDDAEEDTVDLADQIRNALGDFGDLPLGQAAVSAAVTEKPARAPRKGRGKKAAENDSAGPGSDPLNSLVNDDLPGDDPRPKDAEADRVAANTAALEAGMKTLN